MPPQNASFDKKPTKATAYKTFLQALWDHYPSILALQECFNTAFLPDHCRFLQLRP